MSLADPVAPGHLLARADAVVGDGKIGRPIRSEGRPLLAAAGVALLILAFQGHARAQAVSGDGMGSMSSPHGQTETSILAEQHIAPGQIFGGTYGPRVDKPTCPSKWSVYNGSRAVLVPMDSPDLNAATKAASQTIAHTAFQQGQFYARQAYAFQCPTTCERFTQAAPASEADAAADVQIVSVSDMYRGNPPKGLERQLEIRESWDVETGCRERKVVPPPETHLTSGPPIPPPVAPPPVAPPPKADPPFTGETGGHVSGPKIHSPFTCPDKFEVYIGMIDKPVSARPGAGGRTVSENTSIAQRLLAQMLIQAATRYSKEVPTYRCPIGCSPEILHTPNTADEAKHYIDVNPKLDGTRDEPVITYEGVWFVDATCVKAVVEAPPKTSYVAPLKPLEPPHATAPLVPITPKAAVVPPTALSTPPVSYSTPSATYHPLTTPTSPPPRVSFTEPKGLTTELNPSEYRSGAEPKPLTLQVPSSKPAKPDCSAAGRKLLSAAELKQCDAPKLVK